MPLPQHYPKSIVNGGTVLGSHQHAPGIFPKHHTYDDKPVLSLTINPSNTWKFQACAYAVSDTP